MPACCTINEVAKAGIRVIGYNRETLRDFSKLDGSLQSQST